MMNSSSEVAASLGLDLQQVGDDADNASDVDPDAELLLLMQNAAMDDDDSSSGAIEVGMDATTDESTAALMAQLDAVAVSEVNASAPCSSGMDCDNLLDQDKSSIGARTAALFDATMGAVISEVREANSGATAHRHTPQSLATAEAMDALRNMDEATAASPAKVTDPSAAEVAAIPRAQNAKRAGEGLPVPVPTLTTLAEPTEGAFAAHFTNSNNAAMGLFDASDDARASAAARQHTLQTSPTLAAVNKSISSVAVRARGDDPLSYLATGQCGRSHQQPPAQQGLGPRDGKCDAIAHPSAPVTNTTSGADGSGPLHRAYRRGVGDAEASSLRRDDRQAKPPPVRYATEYRPRQQFTSSGGTAGRFGGGSLGSFDAEADLFSDMTDMLTFGKKAVKEAWGEVKQTVRDMNSKEIYVRFGPTDFRLGMRVERRPIDNACEVTYVEPGSAAERIGVRVDDVVVAVDGVAGRGYDHLLSLLTSGGKTPPKRPLALTLLRPQQILNSPLHFTLDDEIKKAGRILGAISSAPETDAMIELMRQAVGFVFMTTAKIGGPVSACGGTGILVARLPDGNWSAPLAVGSFGMSWGFQIGAAVADVMIVFMKPSALWPFMSETGTDIHLGPESGVAVGPIGRTAGVSGGLHTNTERFIQRLEQGDATSPSDSTFTSDNPFAQLVQPEQFQEQAARAKEKLSDGFDDAKEIVTDMSRMPRDQLSAELKAEATRKAGAAAEKLRELKPAYTYSHCKGLFLGVSLEGTAMAVRHDVNAHYYGKQSWSAADVALALEGGLERPDDIVNHPKATLAAHDFYITLRDLTGCHAPDIMREQSIRPPPLSVLREEEERLRTTSRSGSWVPPRNRWDAAEVGKKLSNQEGNRSAYSRTQQQIAEAYNPFREPTQHAEHSQQHPSHAPHPPQQQHSQPVQAQTREAFSFSIISGEEEEEIDEGEEHSELVRV